MRFARPSLTATILAFLTFLLLLTWLLFSLFAIKTAANDLYSQKGQHARILLNAFVNQLPETLPTFPEGLITPDTPAAGYVRSLAEEEDFVRLTLLDINGKVIFTQGRENGDPYAPFAGQSRGNGGIFVQSERSLMGVSTAIVRNGQSVGQAGILLSMSREQARLQRSRQLYMAYFAIDFFLLLGLGSFVLSRIVVRPVNRLLNATERITDGHYGQQIGVSGSAELAMLADSFNAMSKALHLKDQQVTAHVTALEKANDDLQQAREESLRSEKMASIGLLAAGMAHEIGTPLASIMGYAELLTDSSSDPTVLEYAGRISKDCVRIDRTVRGLLDYSRPRGSAPASVDIGRLLAETTELLTRQGALKRVDVQTILSEPLPSALADAHQLQQVLVNLMLNARDAMPEGGKLMIRCKVDDPEQLPAAPAGCLRLDVLDNGSGIAPEHLETIFDPFFTTKPPGKGTGLGLAIAARIMESFGGRITVQSRLGTGTCFTLRLPIAEGEGGTT